MSAWIRPGTSRWNSFFCPSTTTASLRTRRGTSSNRCTGLPDPDEPEQQQRAAAEQQARVAEHEDERKRGNRGHGRR